MTSRPSAIRNCVSRDDLQCALGTVLSQHFGKPCRIEKLRRRRSAYSSSCIIENLDVETGRGHQLSLVFKNLSPASQLPTARRVRPAFLYTPLREIETYRLLLTPSRLGTPLCYGAMTCPDHQLYWLFLERAKGPLLWQIGESESWMQAARWLGRFHTEIGILDWATRQAETAHLLRYNEGFLRQWLPRAEAFLRRQPVGQSETALHRFGRLTRNYDRVVQRVLEPPPTLIHGEFYPSNIVLRASKSRLAVCPIDWEMAALGPGLIDLAALTSGDWDDERKRAMVAAYRDALETSKGARPSLAELMESVEFCQLHLAVQMLGWATNWSPPAHQSRNWLDTACRLSGKLGL